MKIELKFIALKMEFKLDLCFYKKTFRVNSVHLITFDFFFFLKQQPVASGFLAHVLS